MKPSSNTLLQEDSSKEKAESKTKNVVEGENPLEIIVPSETEEGENKAEQKKRLYEATMKGWWHIARDILSKDERLATEEMSSDGSTILHIAVGIGHNDFVKNLFSYINDEQLLQRRHSDGSTALHIAAIVGNKYAAKLLINKNSKLLQIKDHKGEDPLHKAYENMHLETIEYLLKVVDEDGNDALQSFLADSAQHGGEIGVDLLVNAISAKQYSLASELVHKFPKFASKSDDVLMAIAKFFPKGLDYGEALIYPSLDATIAFANPIAAITGVLLAIAASPTLVYGDIRKCNIVACCMLFMLVITVIVAVPCLVASAIGIILCVLVLIVGLSSHALYLLVWKVAKILAFAPVKHIENKKKERREAKKVLELVCDEIDKLEYNGTHHPYYTRPILEAARQNAFKVVDEILFRSREAIKSKDNDGYDIIQLAIIHRSEKVYNLIYDIGERKNLYRTILDSSENNILHLAGRLAPSSVLNQRTGAALQLQRELQWHEEVKKHLFPTYITQKNKYQETPDMVFTKAHEKLVKEGEEWMKTTAESCSITAALIITIVFAAAITVPGGSNQENGIPLFKTETAFIIFAIADAMSLFASSTALLVFLSILTARFAEKDFLISLPRRLFIGLFTLLLSTTAMMVAFSATLFLVFCERKRWMLAPICGLAFIPIAFFVSLQFPLMVDLFRSTYLRIFGKEKANVVRRFNPNDIRLFFGR
ncbi:hypothetical protein QVD17_27559 [Tagetes erecta]|uniref:PGG domain-containing protein n=1 Tax=Tagetes erecta TaxID=13708 RepID=A0AAD8K8Q0_TARER|nr:hypothetical protein QVD17_27559 [Tagetes erecta]